VEKLVLAISSPPTADVCGLGELFNVRDLSWITEMSLAMELVMKNDYVLEHQHLEERLAQLGQELPGAMSGFARLHRKAVEEGALKRKVKEMMALAISIVVGCDGCIAYHVHDSVEAGATRQELLETIGVALLMSGGPGSIYAAHAMDAIEQFIPEAVAAEST
jgi:AhpD family alkylhydroperoxidase